jgi:hypothetical protein
MKTINKLVSALLLFVISFAYAEAPPAPNSAGRGEPEVEDQVLQHHPSICMYMY